MIEIELPLEIWASSKRKFILNLNNYRNTHYQALGVAKKKYKDFIWYTLPDIKYNNPVRLTYTIYPKRKCDIANVGSIVDKFACDALVEKGIISDDDFDHVVEVSYRFGGLDKQNPRAVLTLEEFCIE